MLIAVLFLNRLLTTSISVYRGYSSILEYAAAGCITGALYKFNMGLAGMAVGGGLGTDNFLAAYVIHIGRVHQVLSPLALKSLMFWNVLKCFYVFWAENLIFVMQVDLLQWIMSILWGVQLCTINNLKSTICSMHVYYCKHCPTKTC